jgi:hypothetical protein
MESFSEAKLAYMMVTCDPVSIMTHFVGRTIVCGGSGCTLCGFERARPKHYCLAVIARREVLVEMCQSLYDCAREAFRVAHAVAWPGVIVQCTRTSPRRSWQLQTSAFKPELVAQMPIARAIVGWLSDLYRVPVSTEPEALGAWIRRAAAAHASLHVRALLPGMA